MQTLLFALALSFVLETQSRAPLPTAATLGKSVQPGLSGPLQDHGKDSTTKVPVVVTAPHENAAQTEIDMKESPGKLLKEAIAASTWSNWALFVTAGIAALIALSTLRAIRRQAELTQQTLILTYRPKLIVRGVYVEIGTLQEGRIPTGHFFVVNTGGSNARVREMWSDAQVGQPNPNPYEHRAEAGGIDRILAPGESIKVQYVASGGAVSGGDALGWTAGNRHFFVFGFINYLDEMENPVQRQTAFCRRRTITTGFQSVPDEDYEHTD